MYQIIGIEYSSIIFFRYRIGMQFRYRYPILSLTLLVTFSVAEKNDGTPARHRFFFSGIVVVLCLRLLR